MEICSQKPTFALFFLAFLFLSTISLLPICIALESETEDEHEFTYEEGASNGPKSWGKIKEDWKVCGTGKLQSPIDLLDGRVEIVPQLGKLKRNYKPAPAMVKNRGHDISVRWEGYAGKININGTYYNLVQCHWHSPSEHTLNGSRYQLELHIVHQSTSGEIAVIGILYKYGRPDPFLRRLLNQIKSVGEEEKHLGIVNPGNIKFGSREYYRYIGSLTVPPCTEGVTWTISKKIRTVSREQVHALRNAVHDGFEANSRPIQEHGGRPVFFYTPRRSNNGKSA